MFSMLNNAGHAEIEKDQPLIFICVLGLFSVPMPAGHILVGVIFKIIKHTIFW